MQQPSAPATLFTRRQRLPSTSCRNSTSTCMSLLSSHSGDPSRTTPVKISPASPCIDTIPTEGLNGRLGPLRSRGHLPAESILISPKFPTYHCFSTKHRSIIQQQTQSDQTNSLRQYPSSSSSPSTANPASPLTFSNPTKKPVIYLSSKPSPAPPFPNPTRNNTSSDRNRSTPATRTTKQTPQPQC